MTRLDRLALAVASHRVRSRMMEVFYLGILVTGVLGVLAPSASVREALPGIWGTAAIGLWTALYGITAPIGIIARHRGWYPVELVALGAIILATVVHGIVLASTGMSGIQTGIRLLSGVSALLAVGSMLLELTFTKAAGNVVVDSARLRQTVEREAARAAGKQE